MAPQTAWRCSQCGTVNDAGARACASCGKWPSLFDLQESVEETAVPTPDAALFEPEVLEPATFEPEAYEAETFEPTTFDAGGEEAEERGRTRRWIVTAIWVIGLLVWIVVNSLQDSG